jgi:nitrite reductase/ring-hydroxylating ferredoxin subunit
LDQLSTQERFKRGAADAPRYFQFMADFIGFTSADAAAIRETRFIIEKHIPRIVADFYTQLLRFPATRRHFLHKDGRLNQPYLEMRMQHQAGFWRRTAAGVYDEDYIRFVDYVGRAHTSHGADPKIYIPERYVMGMIGFVQERVGRALAAELHTLDPELELRGLKAWNRLLMVLLEVLARPYGHGREGETFEPGEAIDSEAVHDLAVDTYERALGMARAIERHIVHVGAAADLPPGSRRVIEAEGISVGVFHHTDGRWYALHNSCLHRGGPVCTGALEGDILTCPWHGYQYDVTTGQLLLDRDATLPKYRVELRDGQVYVDVPVLIRDAEPVELELPGQPQPVPAAPAPLAENELRAADLPPGHARRVTVEGEPVAVYNVDGAYYATHDACTHAGGPLSEGELTGAQIVCPWHASCFNVVTGAVECGPAREPLKTYRVTVEGGIVRVGAGH